MQDTQNNKQSPRGKNTKQKPKETPKVYTFYLDIQDKIDEHWETNTQFDSIKDKFVIADEVTD